MYGWGWRSAGWGGGEGGGEWGGGGGIHRGLMSASPAFDGTDSRGALIVRVLWCYVAIVVADVVE